MVLALIANIVLCTLVIVAVVAPLARAIRDSRPEAAALRRRQTAWTSTPAASRMRTPVLGGSDR